MYPPPIPPSSSSFPRIPPPHSSHSKVTFQGAQTWRESIAAFTASLTLPLVILSLIIVSLYCLRSGSLVEELFDYLDKTVSISKINYNHALGLFKLNDTELMTLSLHKSYRTLLKSFLFSDILIVILLIACLLLFLTLDVSEGKTKLIFWIVCISTFTYYIISTHLLIFLLVPYPQSLSSSSSSLLDRSIPHNPGGLLQMEHRFGCTFDLNLYASYERRNNVKNTCDPYMSSAYLPRPLLFVILFLRLLPLILFVLLAIKRTPLSEALAQFMENKKSAQGTANKRLYKKKHDNRKDNTYETQTAKGISVLKESRPQDTRFPPPPSPGIDHSISYNNAAYLATGLNSSRSSELSRLEDVDLFKGATHRTSGSIMSEV